MCTYGYLTILAPQQLTNNADRLVSRVYSMLHCNLPEALIIRYLLGHGYANLSPIEILINFILMILGCQNA